MGASARNRNGLAEILKFEVQRAVIKLCLASQMHFVVILAAARTREEERWCRTDHGVALREIDSLVDELRLPTLALSFAFR